MAGKKKTERTIILIAGEKGGMGKSNIGSLLSSLNNDERDRLNPDAPKHQK